MSVIAKRLLASLLPAAMRVPAKYWLDRLRGYQEPEMALLDMLFRRSDRVVDVGGNRGVYSYRCWKLGARVEVFEPNPTCIEFMAPWISSRSNVSLHRFALSDQAGQAELHIPMDKQGAEHDASASMEVHGFDRERVLSIPVSTLDAFGFKDVAFIKIDVEGHERRVLEGARNTLAESRPALLVEIEQRHCADPIDEVFQSITRLGYEGYFLEEGKLSPLSVFRAEVHQDPVAFDRKEGRYINNFLFLHQSRIEAGQYVGLTKRGNRA